MTLCILIGAWTNLNVGLGGREDGGLKHQSTEFFVFFFLLFWTPSIFFFFVVIFSLSVNLGGCLTLNAT